MKINNRTKRSNPIVVFFKNENGKDILENELNKFKDFAENEIFNNIKLTLKDMGIVFSSFFNEKKLYEVIKDKGNSKIKISIENNDQNYLFELKDKRKFDQETLKYLNKEDYIKKINL